MLVKPDRAEQNQHTAVYVEQFWGLYLEEAVSTEKVLPKNKQKQINNE